MSSSPFRLDPSIANLRGLALRQKYDEASPEERRELGFVRPATDAEAAAAPQAQEQGAPTDFSGPVFANPDHIIPQLDTDPAIPITRLPRGVSFRKDNYMGGAQMGLSNPERAQVLPSIIAKPRLQ